VVEESRSGRFAAGDRVCALLAGGGYAEQVVVPEGQVLPLPPGVGLVEAAALPEVWSTAWLNLAVEAGLNAGDRVIVHAGASGVGTACLQLARLREWRAFATAGSPEKLAACRRFGAEGVAGRHGDWAAVARHWAPDGVDAILDPVGGSYLEANVSLLARGGRLILIGLMGGTSGRLDLARMLGRRLRLIGSTLRSRPPAEKAEVMAALEREVWPAFGRGEVVPVIDRVVPIVDVEAAFAAVASDGTVGKVVLTVP
jgi:NADPH:quinone reductase-like Zn-dependent oxidoreductase